MFPAQPFSHWHSKLWRGHFASVTSCLGPGLLSEMLRELQHAPTGHLTLANLSIKFWRLQDK